MIALVSNITNDKSSLDLIYDVPELNRQVLHELEHPFFLSLPDDNDFITCRSAYAKFMEIIDLVAGEQEKKRAKEIHIAIVDDPVIKVNETRRISKLNALVLETGNIHKAKTLTSNTNLSNMKNVLVHDPRSLIEIRQVGRHKNYTPMLRK
jgi:hypothetical protein